MDADTTNQMLPFVYETKRLLSSDIPLWSWNTFLGQDFLTSYIYYTLTNPFVLFNCLFPYKYIPLGFTITIYLKYLLCGYFSNLYFKKMGFDENFSLLGSLLYTFSSWGITAIFYYMFIDPMMLFPVLLIFIERLIRNEKFKYTGLILIVFFTVWINFYFSVGTLFVSSLYYIYRIFSLGVRGRNLFIHILKAFLCVFFGILLCGIILIPIYCTLPHASRELIVQNSGFFVLVERINSLILPKIMEGKSPFILLPSFYNSNASFVSVFGIIFPILSLIKKRDWIGYLFLTYIILYLTPLNGITSLFTTINYTRWTYALILIIVLSTLTYLKEFGLPAYKASLFYIVFVFLWLIFFGGLTFIYRFYHHLPNNCEFVSLVAESILSLLNLLCLYILIKSKFNRKWYTKVIICCCICCMLQFACFTTWAAKAGFFSEKTCANYTELFSINDTSHDSFIHRYDIKFENNISFPNYGIVHGIPTIRSFHSMFYDEVFLLGSILYSKYDATSIDIPCHPKSFNALMSVKESITVLNSNLSAEKISENINDDFKLRNGTLINQVDTYIPIGFSYDKYWTRDDDKLHKIACDSEDIAKGMLNTLIIGQEDEAILSQYLNKSEFSTSLSLDSLVNARKNVTCDSVKGDSHGLSAYISLESPKVLFFSIINLPGLSATINGEKTKIYDANCGMSALIVPTGKNDVRFEYFPPYLKEGAMVSLYALIFTLLIFLWERLKFKKLHA